MYAWHYYSPDNRHWELTNPWHDGVYIETGGWPELVSTRQDSTLVVPGHRGQILRPDESQVNPMTGTMNVVVDGSFVNRNTADVFVEWVESWDDMECGTLVVDWTKPGHISTKVRLPGDGIISQPEDQPEVMDFIRLSVPIIADSGAWTWTQKESGPTVTIDNTGRDICYPRLTWRYAGPVTMPSGMVINLPAVDGPRILDFDPQESLVVTDLDGTIDYATWRKVRGFNVEGVPRRAKRTYTLPSSASLTWDLTIRDPWR